ncbi:MAG: tyrosine-type recombinase/integrase [Bacteroidetes bacterium]|nr:tyrosine-type recombinase/integrase [Bacteroidota bacterium]
MIRHKQESFLRVQFPDDKQLIQALKKMERCCATQLPESGTDLGYIQELLGHNSSRTTEIYTHVSEKNLQAIRSPFDDL